MFQACGGFRQHDSLHLLMPLHIDIFTCLWVCLAEVEGLHIGELISDDIEVISVERARHREGGDIGEFTQFLYLLLDFHKQGTRLCHVDGEIQSQLSTGHDHDCYP